MRFASMAFLWSWLPGWLEFTGRGFTRLLVVHWRSLAGWGHRAGLSKAPTCHTKAAVLVGVARWTFPGPVWCTNAFWLAIFCWVALKRPYMKPRLPSWLGSWDKYLQGETQRMWPQRLQRQTSLGLSDSSNLILLSADQMKQVFRLDSAHSVLLY